MDWYFRSGIDDFVVPKEQELSDRLPSPESWSEWGISSPENFVARNKCFSIDANVTWEELNFNGKILSDEVQMETSVHDKDHSSASSICGGLLEESQQTTMSRGRPDYQLDDLAKIEQMNDIFLNSLLEDVPMNEDLHKSFCFSPESHCGMLPADNLLTDMSIDSQSISSDKHSMGSSKYLKTHAFSPSVSWEEGEVSASQFNSGNSEQKDCPPVEAPLAKSLVPSDQNNSNGTVCDEGSLEECVLQELEIVMAKLTDRTRICFRDAFYRLAKNSTQHLVSQNGEFAMESPHPPWTGHDEKMRYGRKKTTELETNTIDRAIANLMFNKMDINVREFPVEASMNCKQKGARETGPNYCSNEPQIHHCPHSPSLASDV